MGFICSMDTENGENAGDQCLGDFNDTATPSGVLGQQVKEVTAIYKEKLLQRSVEDLKLLQENYQTHIQTLSEELIILLQDRLEMKEEVDMRKISLEQFIRISQFSPLDIQSILGSQQGRQQVPDNSNTEQTCFDYVLQLSQTECSNKTCKTLTTWSHPQNTNSDDVIHIGQPSQELLSPAGNAEYFTRNRCRSVSVSRLCDNDLFKVDKRTKRYSLRELPCSVRDRTFFQTQIT